MGSSRQIRSAALVLGGHSGHHECKGGGLVMIVIVVSIRVVDVRDIILVRVRGVFPLRVTIVL